MSFSKWMLSEAAVPSLKQEGNKFMLCPLSFVDGTEFAL